MAHLPARTKLREKVETRLSNTLRREAIHTRSNIVQESANIRHYLSDIADPLEDLDEYLTGDSSLSDSEYEPDQEFSRGWRFSRNEVGQLPVVPELVRHITSADDDTYSAGASSESDSGDGVDGEEPAREEPEDGGGDSQKPGDEDSDGQEPNFGVLDSDGEPISEEPYDLAKDEAYFKDYAVKGMAPEILRELKKPSAAGKLVLEIETPKEKFERLEEWIDCLKQFARLESTHLRDTEQRIIDHRQRGPTEL
jgi:hypothetical protein